MGHKRQGADEKARDFQFATGSGVIISVDGSRTSSSLLRRAKAFDDSGWRELVDTYGDRIYRWSLRTGMPPQDATDTTAEVFVAIVRKIKDFRHDRHSDGFRKWVRTISKNKIRDYWRHRQRVAAAIGGSSWQRQLQAVPFDAGHDHPSESRPNRKPTSQQCMFDSVRAEVSARDWAIFERLILDQRPADEVADEFGTSVNVVYLVKSRVTKRLREQAEVLQ